MKDLSYTEMTTDELYEAYLRSNDREEHLIELEILRRVEEVEHKLVRSKVHPAWAWVAIISLMALMLTIILTLVWK
ncbi:hypothetical protein ACFQ1M_09820 [Sungkyunkwania multivorans]|uniref:Uncharacterized protein n=1 Tax=Sungkyunkwania multivorans TaxID=1173618 RepID=A0ABW3D065_9FLAO